MRRTAGVVVIGDEILSGTFADENALFLIRELRGLGVDLRRITVIPDVLEEIADVVPWHAARFDFVFTSGGVGPTHDDVTMAGISRGFGVGVVRSPDLEAKVRGYWGAKLADANLRLADVPEGAVLVYGRDTTWPVVSFQNVYILPGVPALFKRKFLDISDRFRAEVVTLAKVYVGADEGTIAPSLDATVAAFADVKLGSYPRFDERDFRVMLTLEGVDAGRVAAAQDDLVSRLGDSVVKVDEPKPA